MKLEVFITCVDYADFLQITLPVTQRYFEKVTVATAPFDIETQEIATRHGVKLHVTDVWHRENAKFNKAAALNECITPLVDAGDDCWVLVLDADIFLARSITSEIPGLDKRCLYSIRRRMCDKNSEWLAFNKGEKSWSDFPLQFSELPLGRNKWWWEKKTSNPAGLLGYFQLWNLKHSGGRILFPNSQNAARYDIQFAMSFPESMRIYLDNHEVLHLGRNGENWNGRTTAKWFSP